MSTIVPTPQTLNPPSDTALMDALKRDILKSINCARVGTIKNYDPGVAGVRPPTATVQIAQQQVTSVALDGSKTFSDYPPLSLVPVIFLGGGGFSVTWPIAAGDECLLIFHDRAFDNWFTNGAGLPPPVGNLHDISDAFCIVGLRSGPRALGGVSTTSMQMRSDDYTGPNGAGECIDISPGKIQFFADEIVSHARSKNVRDAGGTGDVIEPGQITGYTQGVPSSNNPPTPPEVPT